MGCVRCGRRQVDPASGPSDWRRAVLHGEQVLVCPGCQGPGWTDGLDRCAGCGSTALVKRLGEVVCRGCGRTGAPVPGDAPAAGAAASAGPDAARSALADDVAAAIDRVLGGR